MGKKLLFLMTFLVVSLGLAANVTITGVVLDKADQEPIPGATVQVKAKKGQASPHATATDVDGRFSLSVPSAGVTLEIKFIGMNTVEVKATEAPMRIEMESNTTQMEEVVVTGMGVQDKRLFSGATTKISADESRLSGVSDVSRSLEGRAAGVSVQNVSGTFGTAPKIRVRGATSIYGS
ncbi:MAG: carboxypeptidase-like regulatory domain-containing protein, partial [Muribaculaceae bacterium]|nr:carboxypeptidase-like regulatory domain-containing protein [Muribaculaceae bacterium]